MRSLELFRTSSMAALGWLSLALLASHSYGVTIDPFYAGSYSYTDLGSAPGVDPRYGGLTLLAGSSDTLLIGGFANDITGTLYTIGVTRDSGGHINGFSGAASVFGPGPFNDGGLTYGPGGVLFASQWPVNMLSQYLPGSTSPDKVIDLAPLGVAGSHAAINFSATGDMKLVSWAGGEFYTAAYVPDGFGTYDITSVTLEATLGGGPEGFVYVPTGSPLFGGPSMLVSEFSAGMIAAYDVDGSGNPIVPSRKTFISDLAGAEGAFIDPLTGDFLFSTFGGGDRVIVVTGFLPPSSGGTVPEPSSIVIVLGLGAIGIAISARSRRRSRAA